MKTEVMVVGSKKLDEIALNFLDTLDNKHHLSIPEIVGVSLTLQAMIDFLLREDGITVKNITNIKSNYPL
jgi:hypothetical protein